MPTLPTWFPIVVIGGVCAAALLKGGREERIAAGAFVLGTLATPFIKDYSWGTQWAIFGVDVVYLALLLVIALRSPRYWPLCAAGFQLLGVVTHAASIVDPMLPKWAYVTAGVIWTYLVLAAIAVGTWNAWRGRRQLANAAAVPTPAATRR
jgi:hypothetical protein